MALSSEEIQQKLVKYPEWSFDDDSKSLVSGFEFEEFSQAVEFTNLVADLAQEVKHYPDILIHESKLVTVMVSTSEEDGITDKDFDFIGRLEDVLHEE